MKIKKEFYTYLKSIDNYKKICKLQSLYFQHGTTTVLKHCRNVAYYSLVLARKLENKFNINFNYKALIIGAFLHDLFLYDWHEKDKSHRLHGYTHPMTASNNAKIMCNADVEVIRIIESHMWPLTITKIPNSKEAMIVCLVDKLLAIKESVDIIKIVSTFCIARDAITNQLYISF